MKKNLALILTLIAIFFIPKLDFGQAPNLGTAGNFAVFTSAGAITNTGATTINGNLGAFVGAYSGVPLPTVNGEVHLADAVAAQAATDVCAAYDGLGAPACSAGDIVIGTTLGNGQTLTPGTYCTGAATTINGNLIFDAQNNPNAIFVVQVDGTLGTSAGSTISLINGANLCNVYFQVSGAVSLGPNSVFLGTVLGRGAISLATGATVQGRLLTCVGAINLFNNTITNPCNAPPCPLTISAAAVCSGATATVTATLSAPAAGATYVIAGNGINNTTGATTGVFTGVPNGTYTITATVGSCTYTTSSIVVNCVTPCPAITVSAVAGTINCAGGTTTLTVTATGGTGPYTYSINGGVSFQASNVFNVGAGAYVVIARDANGCTGATATINVTAPLPITLVSATAGICTGSLGSITIVATGGTGTLQYSLNGGVFQASPVFTGLANGSYTVTIRDANNCTFAAATAVLVNCVPACPTITVSALVGTINCAGGSTTLTVTATGGTGPYTYSINGGVSFQASNVFNVGAGAYVVIARDANGCTGATATINVTAPLPITLVSATAGVCTGSLGSITIVATGGTGTLQYSLNGGVFQASPVFTGLANGSYTVTIRDANNCTFAAVTAVLVNCVPACPTITVSALVGTINCAGGSTTLTVTATGGTGPYTYSINGGLSFQSSNVFNINAGAYVVIARDANGCTGATATVNVTAPLPITLVSATAGVCTGSLGTITIVANGGTGALQYSLNGGVFQASPVFTGLPNGSYIVTIRDANNCTFTATVAVLVNCVPACPTITVSALVGTINCAGGTTTLTATGSGGTGPYTYSINGGLSFQSSNVFTISAGSYVVIARDANGCTGATATVCVTAPPPITLVCATTVTCISNLGTITVMAAGGTGTLVYSINNGAYQASPVFTGLPNGSYVIRIRDVNNCIFISQAVVVACGGLCPAIAVTATIGNIVCAGGTTNVTVTATGGTGPYTYSINGGVSFQASNVFTVGAFSYSVIARDANGCTGASAMVNVIAPPPITLVSATAGVCVGSLGSITIVANGGTGALQYSINNGPYQASPVFSGLPNGSYTVKIRDANNCVFSAPAAVIVNCGGGGGCPAITVSALVGNIACYGGTTTFTVTATGGTGPYTYSINGGVSFQSSNVFTVGAFSYSIIAKDANGCTGVSAKINVVAPAPIVLVSATGTCIGSLGTITVVASGGTGTLLYSLNYGPFQSNPVFTGLANGNYTVIIKDANNCIFTAATSVLVNCNGTCPTITVGVVPGTINCAGGTTTLTATGSGGTGPYTYSINGGISFQSSNVFTVGAGANVILARDANGCTGASPTITVTAPLPITLVSVTAGVCVGNLGSITVVANGGTGTLQYSLNGGTFQASPVFTGLVNGNYLVTVRDANNCTRVATTGVIVNCMVNCPLTLSATAVCLNGTATVTATLNNALTRAKSTANASVAVPSATYVISGNGIVNVTGATTGVFLNVPNGTYTITATVGGCTYTVIVVVNCGGCPAINVTALCGIIQCYGGSTSITVGVSGGQAPYMYSINGSTNFQTSNIFTVTSGSYTFTVRDANGCIGTSPVLVTTQSLPIVATVSASTCFNGKSTITVQASGGTGALQYSINNGQSYQSSNVFTNVASGTYTVLVRDAYYCTIQCTTLVLVNCIACPNVPVACPLTLNATAAYMNGFATVTATIGGSASGPVTYTISGNGILNLTGANTGIFTTVPNGTYTITATVGNCVYTTVVIVNCPPALTVFATPNPFSNHTRFQIQSDVSGYATLDLYSMSGTLIDRVYKGNISAGSTINVEYAVPAGLSKNLMTILKVGNKQAIRKLINLQ